METNYSFRLRKTLPRKQVPYACQKCWGEFQMIKHKAGFHAWEEIAVILGSTIELQIHFIQVFSITCSKLIIQIHVKSQLVGCQFPIHLMNWPIWYVWRFCSVQISWKKIELRGENNLPTEIICWGGNLEHFKVTFTGNGRNTWQSTCTTKKMGVLSSMNAYR